MTTIASLLINVQQQLNSVSDTARLDTELLLAHVLHQSRSFLYTHSHDGLSPQQLREFYALVDRRLQGEPLAYLLGHKEFWSLQFLVSKDTLIPRPETELLVQLVLSILFDHGDIKLADLGLGCGAIALAIASERPKWQVHGTEISKSALKVAEINRKRLGLNNVSFYHGNWCNALPAKAYDIIVSNPPYISDKDPHLRELSFEPQSALISGSDGLDDLAIIIQQSRDYLAKNGILFLEHGFEQQDVVKALMLEFGFEEVEAYVDLAGQPRVVRGQWNK